MKKRQIFITQDVANHIDLKKLKLHKAKILPLNSVNFFNTKRNTKQPLYIYDLGFNTQQRIIPVCNHINKTGTNPLRGQHKGNIEFYDITKIYQKQEKAKTAECFGQHKPIKKNTQYTQTRFLCHHTIAAYCAGFRIIFAYVID